MADQKLSALVELTATPADNDEVYIRDVSEAAADESKRIIVMNLVAALAGISQPINSKGNSFATIQAAINDLAGNGWVYVPAGTYNEAVVINDNNVILYGAGWSTIINGGTTGDAISISGVFVVIRDIQVKTTIGQGNLYSGIKIASGGDVILCNNVLVNGADHIGLYFDYGRGKIINCYISNIDNVGIRMGSFASNSIIVGNFITATGDDGLSIHADGENCVVVANRIKSWTNEAIDDDSGTSTIDHNDTTV